MKIKQQWLVEFQNSLQLLVLTENDGYFISSLTNTFFFQDISTTKAKNLLLNHKKDYDPEP